MLCSYIPIKISRNIDSNTVQEIAAGDSFSVFITENRMSGGAEVFAAGCNLKGQLATGQVLHLKDITKVESLSNYTISTEQEKNKKVTIDQI